MSKLSRKIAKRSEYQEKDIQQILELMEDCLLKELCEGGSFALPSVGKFYIRPQKPHRIRNIHTGKVEQVAKDSPFVAFSAYPSFRDKIQREKNKG